MGKSDEPREDYKEWPPVIVMQAELGTKGVEGGLCFRYPVAPLGF